MKVFTEGRGHSLENAKDSVRKLNLVSLSVLNHTHNLALLLEEGPPEADVCTLPWMGCREDVGLSVTKQ